MPSLSAEPARQKRATSTPVGPQVPFPALPAPENLYDYGLIGNMHTAALVSRFGSIDWACMPRFASPSIFARLLDAERGGNHALRPVESSRSWQRYRPMTNVLETTFKLSGERELKITDFMPHVPGRLAEQATLIVRLVSAKGGPVSLAATFHPRFNYGERDGRFTKVDHGYVAESGRSALYYTCPGEATAQTAGRLETTLDVVPGSPVAFELLWGKVRPTPEPPAKLLIDTEEFWRDWWGGQEDPAYNIPIYLQSYVERSVLTLKLLSHCDTGAFVAAPTTSLPEWPGGGRNWDYRYAWVRDAAFTAKVMVLDGHVDEARAFLRWALVRSHRDPGEPLRVLYGVHGETDLTEKVLPHLGGFLSSRPVRIGNAASDQFQLDIYGTLLNMIFMMADIEGKLITSEWSHISRIADEVEEVWRNPDRGLWEMRTPPAHYVHSKLMAWVAMDRSAGLARRFGSPDQVRRWSTEAEIIRGDILERGYDPETNSFVQAYERRVADASTLRIPMVGFLPYTDPKVLGTVERVVRELSDGPFVYRYRADDGIAGPEGAFLLCSFWLIENLARSGNLDGARANWDGLMAAASPLGLFPEEYDPRGRRPLGNYPQAFTHIGVLRAAMAIGRALEGRVEPITTVHLRAP